VSPRATPAVDIFGEPFTADGALFELTPRVTKSLTRPTTLGGVVPPALPPEWDGNTVRLHLPRWDIAWEARTRRGGWPVVDRRTGKVVKHRKVWEALQGNARVHWSQRHAATKEVIGALSAAAQAAGLRPCRYLTVRLVRVVPDGRTADEDNLWPFFKVCCDALARGPRKDLPGLHLVPDDTSRYMNKLAPRIQRTPGMTGLWLEITVGSLTSPAD
jgi:crossover junction endodeoxyribonuclease RusA